MKNVKIRIGESIRSFLVSTENLVGSPGNFVKSIHKFGFLFLELLKGYINTLPTLKQLPTGEDDDEQEKIIR